jgi:nicotinate-nucleotide--dimethylbenzimidazole phosphoribosyltransferase
MADENALARKRAAKRSLNFKAGKPLDDAPEATLPPTDAPAPEEGGIVAEAKEEAAQVQAVEEAQEGGTGSPAEEAVEGEPAPIEAPTETPEEAPAEPAAEIAPEPMAEAPAENPFEAAAEAPAEPMAEAPAEMPMMESQEAADPSHDELIDQYHEALAYGDVDQARELYKQLQDVRYKENAQRTRTEGEIAREMAAYVATAQELADKHPVLGEDGPEVEEVMTLADLYRSKGANPSDALRQAVAKLFPEAPAAEIAPEPPMVETPEKAMEATPEPEAKVAEEEKPEAEKEPAPAEEPEAKAEENPIPDMTARKERKAKLSVVPTASARNEPPAKQEAPTRSSAIAEMRKRRGQG